MIARLLNAASKPCRLPLNWSRTKAMTARPCEWLDARGTDPVIPPRKNHEIQYDYDKTIYKQRNITE